MDFVKGVWTTACASPMGLAVLSVLLDFSDVFEVILLVPQSLLQN
jgi:hypothetical protein